MTQSHIPILYIIWPSHEVHRHTAMGSTPSFSYGTAYDLHQWSFSRLQGCDKNKSEYICSRE